MTLRGFDEVTDRARYQYREALVLVGWPTARPSRQSMS
jgi:hypothetical protein